MALKLRKPSSNFSDFPKTPRRRVFICGRGAEYFRTRCETGHLNVVVNGPPDLCERFRLA